MIRFYLYQNLNSMNKLAYGKYYPRVKVDETYDLEKLSDHMASHNTPFSPGAIKGILTDAVACIKELLMDGKNVKIDDLAIFSVGLRTKQGADSSDKYSVATYISGVKLRARATGKLSTTQMNLEATIREDKPRTPATAPAPVPPPVPEPDDEGNNKEEETNPGGSGSTNPGGDLD